MEHLALDNFKSVSLALVDTLQTIPMLLFVRSALLDHHVLYQVAGLLFVQVESTGTQLNDQHTYHVHNIYVGDLRQLTISAVNRLANTVLLDCYSYRTAIQYADNSYT